MRRRYRGILVAVVAVVILIIYHRVGVELDDGRGNIDIDIDIIASSRGGSPTRA